MHRVSTIALVTIAALIATPAFAVTITLNTGGSSKIKSYVIENEGDENQDSPDVLPDSHDPGPDPTTQEGDSSSTTGYELTHAGFEFTFAHVLTSERWAYSTTEVNLFFSAGSNVGYVLEGNYTADDPDGELIFLEASLLDRDPDPEVYLFQNSQQSDSTPDESFTLGQQGGDSNELSGSLTGTLLADNPYQLSFQAYIMNSSDGAPEPATASGTLRLSFVPEPTTALLLAGGLAGIAAARRRHSHR